MKKKKCYYFTIVDKERKLYKYGFATQRHFIKFLDEQLSKGYRVLVHRTDMTEFDHCSIYDYEDHN